MNLSKDGQMKTLNFGQRYLTVNPYPVNDQKGVDKVIVPD